MALLHILVSRRDGFLSRSQWKSLVEVEGPMTTKEKVDKAGRERARAVDHAMHLLSSQFLGHLHVLFGTKSLYALDDDKRLE